MVTKLPEAGIRRHEPVRRIAATANWSPGVGTAPLEGFIENRTPVTGSLPLSPDSFIYFPEDRTTDHVPNLVESDFFQLFLNHDQPFEQPVWLQAEDSKAF